MSRELTRCQRIEQSILKTYRKELWRPFTHAIRRYQLICPGEITDRYGNPIVTNRVSMNIVLDKAFLPAETQNEIILSLMQLLQRFSDFPFEVRFLVMDPGYNEVNRRKIESNAALLEIPVTIFETDIFQVANNSEKSPCYLCARMRRGHLYSKARELGCNKIALGHHFNDVIETTVLGMFFGSQLQAMPPKLHSTNFSGMELIRPMYCIHEDSVIACITTWSSSSAPAALQRAAPPAAAALSARR